jgi:tripartite-type tricarboxylate transporter receptor subunit TctC
MEHPRSVSRRRLALAVALGSALAMAMPSPVCAQTWPSRPIRIIVPFPPGGAGDPLARIIGQRLSEQLGQPFVVENRGGAGGTIAFAEVARAPADGYTLLLAPAPFAITPFVYAKLPYDAKKDFVPVGLIQTTPTVVVVRPSLGVQTLGQFLELARKQPGKISFGTPGDGSLPHLIGEMINQQAGVKLLHVPYKGGGPALNDLLAGAIDSNIVTPLIRGMVKEGKLVAIGTTSLARTPSTKDWPTFSESGLPGFEALAWFGLVARSSTPPEVVSKLSENLQLALKNPETRAQIAQSGDVAEGTQAEFASLLQREYARWERTVKAAGIKPE